MICDSAVIAFEETSFLNTQGDLVFRGLGEIIHEQNKIVWRVHCVIHA